MAEGAPRSDFRGRTDMLAALSTIAVELALLAFLVVVGRAF